MDEKQSLLDSLIEMLNKGGIDRRNFLRLAGAAGITAVSANTLFAAPSKNCVSCHSQAPSGFTIDPNTQELIDYAHSLGIDLIWDRGAICQNSHKGNGGVAGLCCFRCQMGPCTLGAATGKDFGTCGASKDIVVARDLVRRIAGGAACHVEHARAAAKTLKGVANGSITDYSIGDPAKLDAIYAGLGCTGDNKALAVAEKTLEDLGKDEGTPAWLEYKALPERKGTWAALGILPTGAGAEISEAMHRTTMGVDGDMGHLATDGLKLGLVDGYCGLHAATGIQDVLFGTPMVQFAKTGLSVIEQDKINIIVNGHEPILSEKIVDAVIAYNAAHPLSTQINVVGMCCTGNEVLMRKGVNTAGAMVQQELALATGAVEAMVVDVQCVIPNVQRFVEQRGLHTMIITTNPHAQITGATHIPFEPENADAVAQQIVGDAVANYAARNTSKVHIPAEPPQDIVAGFSVEQIVGALSAVDSNDPLGLLLNLIISNDIRGIVGIVGCVTPREKFGYRHVALTKRLLAENILVVGTGCWAHVAGQYGLLKADPTYPGVGAKLAGVLGIVADAVGLPALPACWHMGSCVDNSRIEDVLNPVVVRLNQMLGTNLTIKDLPVAASAPEFITEKAVSIGTWAVDLGLFTHIGGQPYVSGSANMVDLLTNGVESLVGGKFYVETDPEVAADTIIATVNAKRQALGLPI
jgi:carbon-monoxide dehydrogenase catalytic subunit